MKVIITEDSIRSDLCFNDAEGTVCLLNEEIFEGLARIGAKTTAWNEFSSTMASVIICLVNNQKFNFSKRKQRKEAKTSHDKPEDEDHFPTPSSDPLLSGEDSSILTELMVFCTSLQEQRKSRSGGLERLKRFGSVRRVKSLMKKDGLGAQEDASKQGRMIEKIDQNAEIALDDETQERTNDDEMFGVDDRAGKEVVMDSAADLVTTVKDSAASTTDVTKDEITMAQALAALKSVKPKVMVQEQEMSTTIPTAATIVTTAVPTPRAKAERLQAREREEFSDVQKARLQMSTYLRHVGGYKQSHLKGSSFDEIKELFDKGMRKKQKVDKNVEPAIDDSEELRKCIEMIPNDKDEVLIKATPISSRSPTIIDYKIHKEGMKTYFKIIRADGNSQVYQTFEKCLRNREDLEVLWAIVKDIFKKEKPVDDMDNILFRTLKTMFEHHVEDTIWNYQQGLAKVIHHSEVFGYILLMKIKILIKKLEDSEDEYQVYGRIVRIKSIQEVTVVQSFARRFYCWSQSRLLLQLSSGSCWNMVVGSACFAIRSRGVKCSSCGTLYTRDCGCLKGNVEDKILVPKPPKNCARCTRCGYLVDGLNCQGCALLQQELEENIVTHSPDFQNTSEPSNASTNVINAPREPYVIKQDNGSFVDKIIFDLNRAPDSPNQFHCFHCKDVLRDGEACKRCTCIKCGSCLGKGLCYICGHNQNSLNASPSISKTSSQSPPNINHCCYECGDPLDGIFCKRCTCKSCGKDAHIGYNFQSKVLVISNLEPWNNQTIDELPQTLPIFQPTFHSEAESPFTLDSTPIYVDESPNFFNPPPQPPVYPCEFCGDDAYYGHYCTPQAPFIYPEPCYNQDFNFPQNFQNVP
uniref:Uncharacterized protein n=1 Tax=Tanacetum cinerariifolium TaxID=118510 RepID=A0A699GS33_TANCI|nr:hypothetical protein [Tanacetum cinerariifolium]